VSGCLRYNHLPLLAVAMDLETSYIDSVPVARKIDIYGSYFSQRLKKMSFKGRMRVDRWELVPFLPERFLLSERKRIKRII